MNKTWVSVDEETKTTTKNEEETSKNAERLRHRDTHRIRPYEKLAQTRRAKTKECFFFSSFFRQFQQNPIIIVIHIIFRKLTTANNSRSVVEHSFQCSTDERTRGVRVYVRQKQIQRQRKWPNEKREARYNERKKKKRCAFCALEIQLHAQNHQKTVFNRCPATAEWKFEHLALHLYSLSRSRSRSLSLTLIQLAGASRVPIHAAYT